MAKKTRKIQNIEIERPPVVAVMGHIDHGKSTLLDHIRKSNVTESEAGGITQHISAYEVVHKHESGEDKKITFLDTPGHEAFSAMRSRGAKVADIAILVVAADDGVKTQTLEALGSIKDAGVPYIVAINKIDKPEANIEKTKTNLAENEIYLEGYGGDVPFAAVSAKSGEGVDTLLDTILLVAELAELRANPSFPAEGVVIESNVDRQKGIGATLLIKNGTLKKGEYVIAEDAYSPVRIMEDFLGKSLDQASFSSPVRIIGFNKTPSVGARFESIAKKKDAEKMAFEYTPETPQEAVERVQAETNTTTLPIIIKTDVAGTIDAIVQEIEKLQTDLERVRLHVIHTGVGNISENDIRLASGSKDTIILGFNVGTDSKARDLAERSEVTTQTFDIIYHLTDWLKKESLTRTPKITVEEETGLAKIIRVFSQTRSVLVLGGKVLEGKLVKGGNIKILRRDIEIGRGKIVELQQQKIQTDSVDEGNEFGARIETRIEIAPGDKIAAFQLAEK